MADLFRTGAPQKEETKKEELKKEAQQPVSDFELRLSGITRAMKLLEERYDSIRQQIRFIDQNLLDTKKKLEAEIKATDSELGELNIELKSLKENAANFSKELKMAAKSQDLAAVSKYVEMWEPVEFLTRKQAELMIEQAKRKSLNK